MEADPVRVQRRTVSHFKGLFKTFKMRYSTFLYSNWIGLHLHFKKAILHLKRATIPFLLSLCVHTIEKYPPPIAHRSHGVMLPLRNGPKKRSLFFNTMVCSTQQVEAESSPISYMKKTGPADFSSPGPSLVCR